MNTKASILFDVQMLVKPVDLPILFAVKSPFSKMKMEKREGLPQSIHTLLPVALLTNSVRIANR